MTDRNTELEEQVAHLSRVVEDLSEVVARQARDIDALGRRLGLLMEREAEREVAEGGTIPLADQKPPHW
jgi:SlyX protein